MEKIIDPTYQKLVKQFYGELENFVREDNYEGEWAALLKDGRVVVGSYGSCSGCDAIQAYEKYDDDFLQSYITFEEAQNISSGWEVHSTVEDFAQSGGGWSSFVEFAVKALTYGLHQYDN